MQNSHSARMTRIPTHQKRRDLPSRIRANPCRPRPPRRTADDPGSRGLPRPALPAIGHGWAASIQFTRELACPEDAARLSNLRDRASVMKAYHVADLVIPPPPIGAPATDKPKTTELELIRKITATVEPKSWTAAGGPGTIEYFPLGMALVVNSTPDVQAAVGKYLDAVRKMQDQQ